MATPNPLPPRSSTPYCLLFLLSLLLCSCATSVYLLGEDEKDLVFREELIGRWKLWDEDGSLDDNNNYAVVTRREDSLYGIMTVMDRMDYQTGASDTSYFIGYLVQRDSCLFLNCLADLERPCFQQLGEYTIETLVHTAFICPLMFHNNNEVLELWELAPCEELDTVLKEQKIAYQVPSEGFLRLLSPSERLGKLMVQLVKEHPSVWQKRLLLRTAPPSTL